MTIRRFFAAAGLVALALGVAAAPAQAQYYYPNGSTAAPGYGYGYGQPYVAPPQYYPQQPYYQPAPAPYVEQPYYTPAPRRNSVANRCSTDYGVCPTTGPMREGRPCTCYFGRARVGGYAVR